MRIIKFVFIAIALIYSEVFLLGQEAFTLSKEGKIHWKAAEALFADATNADDLKKVIREFEAVTKTDPDWADSYYNIGELYARIAKESNNFDYLKSANDSFQKFIALEPENADAVEEKLYLYRLQICKDPIISDFVGKWADNDESPSYSIHISYRDGKIGISSISVKEMKALTNIIYRIHRSGNSISFSDTWGYDLYRTDEYGRIVNTRARWIDIANPLTDAACEKVARMHYSFCEYIKGSLSLSEDRKLLIHSIERHFMKIVEEEKKIGRQRYSYYHWEPLSTYKLPSMITLEKISDY